MPMYATSNYIHADTQLVKARPTMSCILSSGMYLSMYHLPHVCCTPVPEIHVRPEMLHVFRYIGVLTCVICNCD